LIDTNNSLFDYGCGHGEDVKLLNQQGIQSSGWDPHFSPENEIKSADIVNLGYVLNVIENEVERKETLLKALQLTKKVLIVSAQVLAGEPNKSHFAYNDGFVTTRNTFQKYFEQQELKSYIDSTLQKDSVPVGLGIYFVFRDESQAESFRASRCRTQFSYSRVKIEPKKFDDYLPVLQPLIDFVEERGRLPEKLELKSENDILKEFRTISRAFSYIKLVTDSDEWQKIFDKRREDMLVYLALSRFERRPKFTALPKDIQSDIKAFFGNYKRAFQLADDMLFSLGKVGLIATACRKSNIGKFVGNALYVHVSALSQLSPILRVFEGCASRTFGQLENTTIIKLRADKPKVSYLHYPDFDIEPHPALVSSMQADLRNVYMNFRDYSNSENPPILHRKETFVTKDYPNYEQFANLTVEEEKLGLLDDSTKIGNLNNWTTKLLENNVFIKDHKVLTK
jgi:DNA phosphorothioation-associated putative methyltransferase